MIDGLILQVLVFAQSFSKKLLSRGNPAKSVLTALLCVVLNSEEKHRLHPGKSDSVCRRIVKLHIQNTRTNCCNYPEIVKMHFYHRIMHPEDADRMANRVDPDQTAAVGAV